MSAAVGNSVVLSNLAYVAGALVVMALLSAVVVLRSRRPRSVHANVESFTKGLQALAPPGKPDGSDPRHVRRPEQPPSRAVHVVGRGAGRPSEGTGADPG